MTTFEFFPRRRTDEIEVEDLFGVAFVGEERLPA
jgi:hypothetical protein